MLTLEEIRNDETKNIEFKEEIPQDSKKFLKTVSAFSNSAGGKIIFGIGAGVGQGIGLVLSKVGMNFYEAGVPAADEGFTVMLPFASTFIRAVTGAVGFLLVMVLQKKLGTLVTAVKDRKGMNAAFWATATGPFIGVSLSLMAVRYTEAGIASTLMALTPVFILWPAHLVFGQKVTFKEVVGAVISVVGVSLFFL